MRVALTILVLLALGCASFGPIGWTGSDDRETLHAIIERGTLHAGTSGTQPPLSMKNRRGELMGLDVEFARHSPMR
ncbi:MAG: hypothetical protein GY910_11065 [bacterium]|nr:hypothetical protein [Deltaproteobacteria bacterium]MCP4905509.1 hypothetical protein [bacterium]